VSEETIINRIKEAHRDQIESATVMRVKRLSVVVKNENFIEVAESLRDTFGFTQPAAGGGVDYPSENRMQMIYYITNPEDKVLLTYRINVPRDAPKLPSLTKVWEALSFHEREAHEMFGFEFEGHPNMIPFLLPPDWRGGHPLRKDFKGEGVTE